MRPQFACERGSSLRRGNGLANIAATVGEELRHIYFDVTFVRGSEALRSRPYTFESRGHDGGGRAQAEGAVEAALRSEVHEIGRQLREAPLAHGAPCVLVPG